MQHLPVILSVLLCGGCAARQEVARHEPDAAGARVTQSGLTVIDYDGAAGYGRRIEFDGSALQIVATSDYGQADKRIWERELTKAERAFLSERVEQASRHALKPQYRDPDVWDGLQIHYELRPKRRPAQSVSVANWFVEELAALTDGLNALLPAEHRVRYREWKEEKDRLEEEAARTKGTG